ncbi:MAG TPA: glycosyltransferase family 1 protein [Chromatiaceae bacterium]|jgi:glycosyltransferase involved in cell wall biosynthesis|nr:glycosyltransferase family 1 protein [Chromatiaceae bacterium]HIN81608.1 glycosyltransferase family 1 protein [Chromatiales bacterium]HIO02582.1 glycosyltransferase family 1 protein [Alphaproteobacteria bacterium]
MDIWSVTQPHIGIVSPEFPPDIGGIENYALGYVLALAKLDYRVTVFTRKHDQGEISLPDIEIRPVLKLRRALDRGVIKNPAIDVWHCMNAAYAWVAEETHRPVVVSVHGNDFLHAYIPMTAPAIYQFGPLWRWETQLRKLDHLWLSNSTTKIKQWLPKTTGIVTNSHYTEKVLLEKIPACRGKTLTALVAFDPFFLELPLHPDERHDPVQLISITRLSEPRKNIHRVLKALSTLKNKYDFRYTIVGDGAYRSDLEALASQLGLAERVQFTGKLSGPELRETLLQSDLFILTSSILPTSHEGFGLVYLEAAACGVPSLAARIAGAAEAIEDGISGYFVDEPETDNIAAALDRFLGRDIRFSRSRCREFSRRFSWEQVVDKAVPFYNV